MDLEQFVTKLLNVKESDLQELITVEKSDESIEIKLRLKPKPTTCPLCGGNVKIHGYYRRKLIHSVFANRNCTLFFQQRRLLKLCQAFIRKAWQKKLFSFVVVLEGACMGVLLFFRQPVQI